MSMLTLGTTAFDIIETPFAQTTERVMGGVGSYATLAACLLTDSPRLICVVGSDWTEEHSKVLSDRGADLEGLEIRANEKTAFWHGRYEADMDRRTSVVFDANVTSAVYSPIVPESYKTTPYVFLGCCSPFSSLALLDKIDKPKMAVADTIELYIEEKRAELLKVMSRIDGFVLNEDEAKKLTEESDCFGAAKKIFDMAPNLRFTVVKLGCKGAVYVSKTGEYCFVPSFKTTAIDPTGAGDSFGGAFMAWLDKSDDVSFENVKKALTYATAVASFTVEKLSIARLLEVTREEIDKRAEVVFFQLECGRRSI